MNEFICGPLFQLVGAFEWIVIIFSFIIVFSAGSVQLYLWLESIKYSKIINFLFPFLF